MSTKKVLAAAGALALGLTPAATLAHTNSIGYVGDGQGGITFWYGSWHGGTNFNEAEIKLEGANGTSYTTTITQFNLLQNSTPAGLIPGTNYFTSDGTQLVPYDPTGATNGGTTQTSYTWQGLTFSGLLLEIILSLIFLLEMLNHIVLLVLLRQTGCLWTKLFVVLQ